MLSNLSRSGPFRSRFRLLMTFIFYVLLVRSALRLKLSFITSSPAEVSKYNSH
jgi:hypothetical protein